MRRSVLLLVVPLTLALGALFSLRGADAADILVNGGFEAWAGGELTGWSPTIPIGQRVMTPMVPVASGLSAVRLDGDRFVKQTVPASPFAMYTASAQVAAVSGSGVAHLKIRFLDSAFLPAASPVVDTASLHSAVPAFKALLVATTSPAGTAWIEFVLETMGLPSPFSAVFDAASLNETLGPTPTPVPTNEPLPTAVPSDTPIPPPPGPPAPTATSPAAPGSPTVRPTSTPKPPPNVPTLKAATQAAAARTPTVIRPRSISPVRPDPNTDAGGLLANGDFERSDSGQPSFWRKFGGSMFSVSTFHGGATGGLLLSGTKSTKWLYQDAVVEPGQWYEARAWAQIPSGEGAAFIRLAWYATSEVSGRRISAVDSDESTSHSWTELNTGPVQAPAGAHSVRFRLMLRPRGPSSAVFDDASLLVVDEPDTPPSPKTSPQEDDEGGDLPSGIRLPLLSRDGGQPVTRDQSTPGLRISEVMPDPLDAGRDTQFEWVEIVNVSDTSIDLSGWKLGDARALDAVPAAVVAPGAAIIIAARNARLPEGVTVVRVADGVIGTGLNNDGDTVRLVAPDGTTADSVSYGSDSSVSKPGPPAPGQGRSLRRDLASGTWAVIAQPGPGALPAIASEAQTAAGPSAPAEDVPRATEGEVDDPPRRPIVSASPGSSNAPYYVLGALGGVGALGLAGLFRQRARRRDDG